MRLLLPRICRFHLVIAFTGVCYWQFALAASDEQDFDIVEASIPEMQQAMENGQVTARQLVEKHLVRIALYEERVNAVIAVNPNALAEADRLDAERARGAVRGPLHGIPVALKDNIHTVDMPTTGGALAFRNFTPPYEATLTTYLREAGAIIIANAIELGDTARLYAAGADYVFLQRIETARAVEAAIAKALAGDINTHRETMMAAYGVPGPRDEVM